MAKRRREKMSEGKKNIIASLIQEYDIKSASDIQEALKDLLGGTIQEMMEAELDEHLGYEEYERSNNSDYRNGVKHKTLRSSYGEIPIDVPQDRDGDFDPKIVPKRKKDISEIEQKIIAMSAKGMTTRQISDMVEDIYGFEVSESMVTAVTNKILPLILRYSIYVYCYHTFILNSFLPLDISVISLLITLPSTVISTSYFP